MYKIMMYVPRLGKAINMPSDMNLGHNEAVRRMRLYKARNNEATFWLVNKATNSADFVL